MNEIVLTKNLNLENSAQIEVWPRAACTLNRNYYPSCRKAQTNLLKRGERSDTYLTHVLRLLQSIENLEKIGKNLKFSTSTAFIGCRKKLK